MIPEGRFYYLYELRGDTLGLPVRVDIREPLPGDIVQICRYLPRPHWTGWVACEACNAVFVGVVECPRMGRAVQDHIECPTCAGKAIPEAHWFAAAKATCECGHWWVCVLLEPVEIFPQRLRCPSCHGSTDSIEPWPSE